MMLLPASIPTVLTPLDPAGFAAVFPSCKAQLVVPPTASWATKGLDCVPAPGTLTPVYASTDGTGVQYANGNWPAEFASNGQSKTVDQ
mgnify:CR=1 FL=1